MIDSRQPSNDKPNNKASNQQIMHIAELLNHNQIGQLPSKIKTNSNRDVTDEQMATLVHFLHRSSYGFSATELDFAVEIGLDAYLEYQLAPEAMDTSVLDGLLNQALPSVQMSYQEIFERLRADDDFDPGFEVIAATLLRAAFNPSQLYELMVEFWSNHFNVNIFDGPIRALKVVDDRDNIRPYALSRFKDLLQHNAKSPAMLFYLDGYTNTVDGPNENYARELMELHTLGVDGGYTENDVKEVARCFTGWTINQQSEELFYFHPAYHDTDSKTVLGHDIPAGGGVEDGEMVLEILASHPSTAAFIAKKLCQRFISDAPPHAAITAVTTTFLNTDGDIKSMLRTLFSLPEFSAATGLKFKRPVEYVLSIFRSLQPLNSGRLFEFIYRQVVNLGQTPFAYPAPTGYSDNANSWLNTNALLDRWNLGTAIAFGDLNLGRNVGSGNNPNEPTVAADYLQIPVLQMLGKARTAAAITDQMIEQTLHHKLSQNDRNALIELAANGSASTAPLPLDLALDRARAVLGALLASRHFQQR